MADQDVIGKINEALAEEFELDIEIMVPDASIYETLALDSLDTVDMVVVLEQEFGIKIREEDAIKNIRTLGEIHSFVLAKLADG